MPVRIIWGASFPDFLVIGERFYCIAWVAPGVWAFGVEGITLSEVFIRVSPIFFNSSAVWFLRVNSCFHLERKRQHNAIWGQLVFIVTEVPPA